MSNDRKMQAGQGVNVGETAGFTLLCGTLQSVAGESRIEHLGMGEEIKHLILPPGSFMENRDLILNWHCLVFYDIHMKSIEVLFTNSYWGEENGPVVHVWWGDYCVIIQPFQGSLDSLPEKKREKDDHHEAIEEKDLLHDSVSLVLGSFQKYILKTGTRWG